MGFWLSSPLFLLGEIGCLALIVGPTVLQECEGVVRRKVPTSLPLLAQLLEAASTETAKAPSRRQIAIAKTYVRYGPDARVLGEAIHAKTDWFLTHDKEHFLRKPQQNRTALQNRNARRSIAEN